MRTCPACGLDVEDSYSFCPDDGASLIETPQAGAAHPAEIPVYAQATPAAPSAPPTEIPAYAQATLAPPSAPPTKIPVTAQATKAEAGSPPSDVVVMYCGECAAEYPMTFVECPVHHAVLRSYKARPVPPAVAISPVSDTPMDQPKESEPDDHVETLAWTNTFVEASEPTAVTEAPKAAGPVPRRESRSWSPPVFGVDYRVEDYASREHDVESRFNNPGFRVVAATLVVVLALFCVVAVYILFSGGARKTAVARAAQPVSEAPVEEPLPLIQTPAEALDYKEESAVVPASPATLDIIHPDQIRKTLVPNTESVAPKPKAPARVRPAPGLIDRTYTAPAEPAIPRPSIAREVPSPRFEQASVGAKLIRMRSMRTASGVRYDLTFDLQDESGRHAQWERMQISTRAASGVSHSQAIPFVHRLGASGALTFTVSVEMRGRSEADWQGRVVCTTMGSDNDGKPLRASFGTNVTP